MLARITSPALCLPCCAQTLLHIFQQLLAAPALTPEVCTYTKLVLKCFWSATYVDIPPLLLKPEVCAGWMGALMTCMQQDLPEVGRGNAQEEVMGALGSFGRAHTAANLTGMHPRPLKGCIVSG
jgi:hypothetical protein